MNFILSNIFFYFRTEIKYIFLSLLRPNSIYAIFFHHNLLLPRNADQKSYNSKIV